MYRGTKNGRIGSIEDDHRVIETDDTIKAELINNYVTSVGKDLAKKLPTTVQTMYIFTSIVTPKLGPNSHYTGFTSYHIPDQIQYQNLHVYTISDSIPDAVHTTVLCFIHIMKPLVQRNSS